VIEVLISLVVTLVAIGSVFGFLDEGQTSFDREADGWEKTASTRAGLALMSRELSMAGYKTPPAFAVTWSDGGGSAPDQITIVYADPNVPTSIPVRCGARSASGPDSPGSGDRVGGASGACRLVEQSSTMNVDPSTLEPSPASPEDAYQKGMVLMAIETRDCNGDGQVGFVPMELTQSPTLTHAGEALTLSYEPGLAMSELDPPRGFNGAVDTACAMIGHFKVVQYRVSPQASSPYSELQRRDLSTPLPAWAPVSENIENLQVVYSSGAEDAPFAATPANVPHPEAPETWITRVRVSLTGRAGSTGMQRGVLGVHPWGSTRSRMAFAKIVSLRNQLDAAQQKAQERSEALKLSRPGGSDK
jgi:hypothetical protein